MLPNSRIIEPGDLFHGELHVEPTENSPLTPWDWRGPRSPPRPSCARKSTCSVVAGGMAERTIATVLKTVEVQASGGSNPPPSAIVVSRDIGKDRTCSPSSRCMAELAGRWLTHLDGTDGV